MLPDLGPEFGVSAEVAAGSLTAYLVGVRGADAGLRHAGAWRSVVVAYLVYVASSAMCALAEDFVLFQAGRVIQGAANAFTMPLLLAAVASETPPRRLGRALGPFASLQAAGNTCAPLLGGLAAEASWRLAFGGVAVVAALLAAAGLPTGTTIGESEPVRLRSAWRPAVLRAGLVALVGWACLGGLTLLVAFRAEDTLGLGTGARGVLLTGFSVLSLLSAGRRSAHRPDRRAAQRGDRLAGRRGFRWR